MEDYIKIGQIINTQGHRGELKIWPLTDDPARFSDLKHVYIRQEGIYQQYSVEQARIHKNLAVIKLREIQDMNAAEKLKGFYLELPQSQLNPLPAGHYYIFQLIGLKVFEKGVLLGELKDVLQTGSNDVYVVGHETGKDIYIPALKEVVQRIDLETGMIEVHLPLGLLD